MVKVRNKRNAGKRNVSNTSKKKTALNPFEMHVNKEKLRILGRKTKNDKGAPGVSRFKALKKRKHTLLREYNVHNKSNKFIDKRIGEHDKNISEQDKSLARYSAIKKKAHKKSIFNLADEVLTHRGQTLNEIENFDDPRSDNDDEESIDENPSGKLDSNFVEEAHFGGGLFKRTGINGAKSHKDLIDQLIAESKKRKAEKQKMKEQTLELTEKLDTEWKDLLPLVSKTTKTDETITGMDAKSDYDKVVQELKFEARGTPSDRLKSEDEIAKEEREKLEKLERERLERMRGFIEEKPSSKSHRSADDLADNFAYDSEPEVTLSYNVEGESNLKIQAELLGQQTNKSESESEKSDDDDEDSSNSESEEDNLSDLKEDVSESEEEQSQDVSAADKVSNQSNSDEESISNEAVEDNENENITSSEKKTVPSQETETVDSQQQIKLDLLKRKEIMDQARKELPYTFDLPEDYDSLRRLLKNKSPVQQSVILERMIKCNHPSLAEGNKKHLGMLFVYLLQHINDLSSDACDPESTGKCFQVFSFIAPYMYDLVQFDKEDSQKAVLEVIKEKQADFRKKPRKFPEIDVLLFLKLVSCLFPTSDFRHQVVTPSLVFIDQMLNNCRVRNKKDIAFGLFLVTLISEYTYLSNRYLPSALNFLSGVLHMAVQKTGVRLVKVMPPFKPFNNDLVLEKNLNKATLHLQLNVGDLSETDISDEFKVQSLYTVLSLLINFLDQFRELSSNCEIFENSLKYLSMIKINNYPDEVQKQYDLLKDQIEALRVNRNLNYIVPEKKRPKALRLYEPNIQRVYDGKRHKIQSKEKMERAKLLQKLKKERKGALREIRLDSAFLGRVKIAQQVQGDLERKQKVKRLFAEASVQQSELNAMKRKKK